MLKVNEIFLSIEGEGINSGYPTVFIRLFECNMECNYCDSLYACKGNEYKEYSIPQIITDIKKYNCSRVTLTGGEPLIQDNSITLVEELSRYGFVVNIETNGSIDITPYKEIPNVFITMDFKTIDSGMSDLMLMSNLPKLGLKDSLKFVVQSEQDLEHMKAVLQTYYPTCSIFVSPVFGKIEPKDLVQFVLKNNLFHVRTQLQIHKYIWDPNERGV